MITRAMGDSLGFSPPLIITESQIDDMLARVGKALDETHAWLRERQLVAA